MEHRATPWRKDTQINTPKYPANNAATYPASLAEPSAFFPDFEKVTPSLLPSKANAMSKKQSCRVALALLAASCTLLVGQFLARAATPSNISICAGNQDCKNKAATATNDAASYFGKLNASKGAVDGYNTGLNGFKAEAKTFANRGAGLAAIAIQIADLADSISTIDNTLNVTYKIANDANNAIHNANQNIANAAPNVTPESMANDLKAIDKNVDILNGLLPIPQIEILQTSAQLNNNGVLRLITRGQALISLQYFRLLKENPTGDAKSVVPAGTLVIPDLTDAIELKSNGLATVTDEVIATTADDKHTQIKLIKGTPLSYETGNAFRDAGLSLGISVAMIYYDSRVTAQGSAALHSPDGEVAPLVSVVKDIKWSTICTTNGSCGVFGLILTLDPLVPSPLDTFGVGINLGFGSNPNGRFNFAYAQFQEQVSAVDTSSPGFPHVLQKVPVHAWIFTLTF